MQDEPETLAASNPEEGSPRTIAASANPGSATPAQAYAPAQVDDGATPVPQPNGGVGATMPAYVYAIGRIEPRFPTLSAEKEFAQATGRAETAGLDGPPGAARKSFPSARTVISCGSCAGC